MTSHLDALVELNKQVAVEKPSAEQEQEEVAERETDVQDDPFERPDFAVPLAILVFGKWWGHAMVNTSRTMPLDDLHGCSRATPEGRIYPRRQVE